MSIIESILLEKLERIVDLFPDQLCTGTWRMHASNHLLACPLTILTGEIGFDQVVIRLMTDYYMDELDAEAFVQSFTRGWDSPDRTTKNEVTFRASLLRRKWESRKNKEVSHG